jgi:uncharacterized protein YheU (UPF0270 family)
VRIPPEELSPEALDQVIESFVLREGTDYGHEERTLAEKRASVRRQLESGEAMITFDARTGSIDIRPADGAGEREKRPR